jgi:hypothetical protein
MQYKWPFITVASLVNAFMVTGAFIEFKLRGMNQTAMLKVHPLLAGAGIFVSTFLLIVAVLALTRLFTGINTKMKSFNESLSNPQVIAPEF